MIRQHWRTLMSVPDADVHGAVMKPKIADLERQAQDYDQALLHSEFYLQPLLRLARAAKAADEQDEKGSRVAFSRAIDEMRVALDAFDWGDE